MTYHDPAETVPANAALLVNTGGLYEDYIRVYLPPSANFDDLQVSENGAPAQSVSPEDFGVEDNRQWVAYDLILNVNETTVGHIAVRRPICPGLVEWGGALWLAWERQINALTWPISVDVKLPSGHNYQFQSDLSVDREWKVGGDYCTWAGASLPRCGAVRLRSDRLGYFEPPSTEDCQPAPRRWRPAAW